MTKELDLFLDELSKLSEKRGLYIGGCGCCGSPFIYNNDDELQLLEIEFHNGKYISTDDREVTKWINLIYLWKNYTIFYMR